MPSRVRKVVILNGNHLCHNPRVIKEADCLAAAGFDVEVLGGWLDTGLAARDRALAPLQRFRFTPVFSLLDDEGRASLHGKLLSGERWLGMQSTRWLGLQSPFALGYGMRALLAAARSREAGLYIAHSEPALWVVGRLADEGRRIGVDMEDWFSQDLMPKARSVRPLGLLRELEARTLRLAAHSTCTSQAMSVALAEAYGVETPRAIYNAFRWSDREGLDNRLDDRRDRSSVSLHWFSQSIGPGRGLEDLFACLPLLHGQVEIHIRGSLWSGHKAWLKNLVPAAWRDRVHVHPVVANDALLSRIAEHDIGLSLEPDSPPNKNLTVSNKILQYAQAGLAIVASATTGNSEVASKIPVGVRFYAPGNSKALAAQVNSLAVNAGELARAKSACLSAAKAVFCWEKVAPDLVASVERAFASSGKR